MMLNMNLAVLLASWFVAGYAKKYLGKTSITVTILSSSLDGGSFESKTDLHSVSRSSVMFTRVLQGPVGESVVDLWFLDASLTWHDPLSDQLRHVWIIIFLYVRDFCLGDSGVLPKILMEAAAYFINKLLRHEILENATSFSVVFRERTVGRLWGLGDLRSPCSA